MSDNRSTTELEHAYAQAQERYGRAEAALGQNPTSREWAEFSDAADALVAAERALSLARGQPTAVVIDWPAPWDIGAPLPHVFMNGRRTLLAYYVRQPNPTWDGTTARVVDPSKTEAQIAIVEFLHCTSARFGAPNDDALDGHPLHKHGLEAYRTHVVENSEWTAELQRIDGIDPRHRPESWQRKKHYLLTFHDNTFEAVAESFKVERFEGTLVAVFSKQVADLLAR
jgi:hypothetical protein